MFRKNYMTLVILFYIIFCKLTTTFLFFMPFCKKVPKGMLLSQHFLGLFERDFMKNSKNALQFSIKPSIQGNPKVGWGLGMLLQGAEHSEALFVARGTEVALRDTQGC